MYSTGMSQSSVQNIANVVGQIAAGQIDSLNGSGAGNLVVMAASNAGESISDLLTKGITADKANILLESMVDYLADIYNETKDNNVVQQQYAQVFGITASDLKAAASLRRSNKVISSTNLNYAGMNQQLTNMLNSMYSRTSIGALSGNVLDNLNYNMASSIANNPILYGIYSLSQVLKDTTGGVAIPSLSVLGTGVDLETTVSDLMNVGVLAGGLLGSIGSFASSLKGGGGLSANGMLKNFRRYSSNVVSRGSGKGLLSVRGEDVSESGEFEGNSSSNDVKTKTINDAATDANEQLEQQEDQTQDTKLKDVNESIISIYELLQEVVTGSRAFNVTFESTAWS